MNNSGADKIIINTALSENPELVKELVRVYGSQCVVASVDYRYEAGSYVIYSRNGQRRVKLDLSSYIYSLMDLQVGEIYLNSIDRDGTGQGYCMEALGQLPESCHLPVIIAGGAGNQNHLLLGLQHPKVDASATANLFNFVGNGLPNARRHLLSHSANLAQW
jgi:cyclase